MNMRSFGRIAVICLFAATMWTTAAWAATDPLAGNWKLNPAKSKLTDEMKVTEAGPNTYALNFTPDNTETIVADGTDQPGLFGSTFSITVLSPHRWKMIRKTGGKMAISAIWELSDDGNTLTDHFTGYRADGTTSNLLYKYARIDGGSGFAGTWESVQEQVDSVYVMQIQGYADEGLSFISPAQKVTKNIRFDGKDYAAEGPNLPVGYATSGRRLSGQSVELTDKINGKVLDTQQVELSPDGKTLTITTQIPGRRKPNIQVFERE